MISYYNNEGVFQNLIVGWSGGCGYNGPLEAGGHCTQAKQRLAGRPAQRYMRTISVPVLEPVLTQRT
jgi:hypothetical protein